MAETWRTVVGFDNYHVSDLGRIKTVGGGGGVVIGRIRKLRPDKDGYMLVDLRLDGRSHTKKVHHLVLEAFTGSRNGLEGNHENGDKSDNTPGNLSWVTHRENIKHAVETGLMPDNYALGPRGPLS